eukprot:7988462-Pyramimonas_sp.AAC.1
MGADEGEVKPEVLERGMPEIAVDPRLDEPPDADEIARAIAEMKESQSGEDDVTINMIKWSGDRFMIEIVKLIRGVW